MAALFPSLVAEMVKFANKKAVPFLVFNTAHRAMTTLSQIDHSIKIYLNKLNDMKIFLIERRSKLVAERYLRRLPIPSTLLM
ncbi:uncharacterized protein FFUJ_02093 [Fusarium fujikuroi IMI 58289]|uniref:Uncharacterized protein n=1 Tax=Gibberella fujikuroi (strain CBS 195.34 / IMI 58289 / NRRL A-6831) TaxID=1279085 RepID=S0DXH5_GIBF5|nr:uncharacterized protein FFUJ_02093 [Fusarium fujikuroi IMI 58289]CCT65173.1 uncharacterized protein FFUJ_02093 [Fusarium fujikuroi IMI 58289]